MIKLKSRPPIPAILKSKEVEQVKRHIAKKVHRGETSLIVNC